MGDALALHLEALDDPVACGDGVDEAVGDQVLANVLDDVELGGALLGDVLFGDVLQLGVEPLEEIFEEEGDQLAGELQALVAVVVPVVDFDLAEFGEDCAAEHDGRVDRLHLQVALGHGHVRQQDLGEQVLGLLRLRLLLIAVVALDLLLDAVADVGERLELGEDLVGVGLVQAGRERLRDVVFEADQLDDLLVGDDAEAFEQDGDRDVLWAA